MIMRTATVNRLVISTVLKLRRHHTHSRPESGQKAVLMESARMKEQKVKRVTEQWRIIWIQLISRCLFWGEASTPFPHAQVMLPRRQEIIRSSWLCIAFLPRYVLCLPCVQKTLHYQIKF
eukprot:145823-Amphidinium_carterae.1